MLQFQTHIVYESKDKLEQYLAVQEANLNLDPNDFCVDAYVNPAWVPGPKPNSGMEPGFSTPPVVTTGAGTPVANIPSLD